MYQETGTGIATMFSPTGRKIGLHTKESPMKKTSRSVAWLPFGWALFASVAYAVSGVHVTAMGEEDMEVHYPPTDVTDVTPGAHPTSHQPVAIPEACVEFKELEERVDLSPRRISALDARPPR